MLCRIDTKCAVLTQSLAIDAAACTPGSLLLISPAAVLYFLVGYCQHTAAAQLHLLTVLRVAKLHFNVGSNKQGCVARQLGYPPSCKPKVQVQLD